MKKLIIILLLSINSISVFSQEFNFIRVDSVEGTKTELYIKAKKWVVNNFKSAKDVIQMDDKEAGTIIAKGMFKIPIQRMFQTYNYNIHFTMSIDLRDGKFRVNITNVYQDGGDCDGKYFDYSLGDLNNTPSKNICPTKVWESIRSVSKEKLMEILNDFEKAMKSEVDDF